MVLIATAWAALAAPPEVTCSHDQLPPIGDSLSVAWVSPMGKRVGGATWVSVVATSDLTTFARGEDASIKRLLEVLGLRAAGRKRPARKYKVVVFDVARDTLCRPVADAAFGSTLAGVGVCDDGRPHPRKGTDDCGFTLDTATAGAGLPVFRARWSDLAQHGFCVLPADRYLLRQLRRSGRPAAEGPR
ncbi:MAG: hypothetical protein KTR31_20430 [Myxococcales bacterium]|nr:hypothetical protein [Myxococcales bacterium]